MNTTACVIFGFGCSRSELEAARLVEYLRKNRWRLTTDLREADMVFVGTCGVTRLIEELSVALVSIAAGRKRAGAKLVVFGCMPVMNGDRLRRDFNAITVTPRTMDKLDGLLDAEIEMRGIGDPNEMDTYSRLIKGSFPLRDRFLVRARAAPRLIGHVLTRMMLGRGPQPPNVCLEEAFSIVIGRGCSENCSYCAINRAVGPLVSKPPDAVLAEFREGLAGGYGKFHLVAGDVGAYGQDIGIDITVLLRKLFEQEGDFQLFLDEFNPKYLVRYFPQLFELFAKNSRRIGILTLPVQSGSLRVIESMNRGYSIDSVKECLLALRRACPEIVLGTHVLVGFPGESESDFARTLEFLRQVGFSYVEAFMYEERADTESAGMREKVPGVVKHWRLWRLRREFRPVCRIH